MSNITTHQEVEAFIRQFDSESIQTEEVKQKISQRFSHNLLQCVLKKTSKSRIRKLLHCYFGDNECFAT